MRWLIYWFLTEHQRFRLNRAMRQRGLRQLVAERTAKVRHVYVGIPKERSLLSSAVDHIEDLMFRLGSQQTEGVEYHRLSIGYQGVDSARNYLAAKFMQQAKSDDDTLVMLDDDHEHPTDLVERLVKRDKPIVGALAVKRKDPWYPVAYAKDPRDGKIKIPKQITLGFYKVSRIGGAAIAIQKQVFDKLVRRGFNWPWFRFGYEDWSIYHKGEDVFFCECCDKAGIPIYVDTTIVTPHLDLVTRDVADWSKWLEEHPDLMYNGETLETSLMDELPEKYREKD